MIFFLTFPINLTRGIRYFGLRVFFVSATQESNDDRSTEPAANACLSSRPRGLQDSWHFNSDFVALGKVEQFSKACEIGTEANCLAC